MNHFLGNVGNKESKRQNSKSKKKIDVEPLHFSDSQNPCPPKLVIASAQSTPNDHIDLISPPILRAQVTQPPHQAAEQYYRQDNPEMQLTNLEEAYQEIKKFDFVSKFIMDDEITCPCGSGCPVCKEKKNLKISGIKEKLNKHFQDYFLKNYENLLKFIKDKYKIQIQNFKHWVEVHEQISKPNTDKKFIFRCIKCKVYYTEATQVFILQGNRICASCTPKLSEKEKNDADAVNLQYEVQQTPKHSSKTLTEVTLQPPLFGDQTSQSVSDNIKS